MGDILTLPALEHLLGSPMVAQAGRFVSDAGPAWMVVDLDAGALTPGAELLQPPCTVIGLSRRRSSPVPGVVDVVAKSDDDLDTLVAVVERNPMAARVLVQLLRHNETASVTDGLFAESLAYSTLQHGAEFERWLGTRPPVAPGDLPESDLVLMERSGDRLTLTLNRPGKRNAYSAALRDALCSALELPLADATLREVVIRGAGAAFSAGGDLGEFGQARDAALAHVVRTHWSAAALIHRLRDRVVCHLHGACIGAGIELPSFAGRVTARDDAFFQLPEVAMGLIPGAGGTVGISKRVGRHNAAFLALSNRRIDAATALAWGLVDEIANTS